MKKFVIILLLFNSAKATDYYVSNSGSDANSGTSTGSPWASLTKVNSFTFTYGDHIYFNRGDAFFGTIQNPKTTGTASISNRLYYDAYGTGARPIIYGTVSISSWTETFSGSNIWRSVVVVGGTSDYLQMVTKNDKPIAPGRYPDIGSSPSTGDYLIVDAVQGSNQILDAALPLTPDFDGGEIVMRKERWTTGRDSIANDSSHYIRFVVSHKTSGGAAVYTTKVGWGYFIQHHLSTLTVQDEWYWSRSTKQLYYYSTTGAPTGIKVATKDTMFTINNKDYITIQNLAFSGYNEEGICIDNTSTHITVKNCTIKNTGEGVKGVGASLYTRVESDSLLYCTVRGVHGYDADSFYIADNYMNHIGDINGMGAKFNEAGGGPCSGISFYRSTSSITIQNNIIKNIGFGGICFQSNDNVYIGYNLIDTFCLTQDDVGGIYTWSPSVTTNVNRVIEYNVVMHGIGALYGQSTSVTSTEGNAAFCYYFDNYAGQVEVNYNTGFGGGRSVVYLHGNNQVNFRGNTFIQDSTGFSYKQPWVVFTQNLSDHTTITNCKFRDNIVWAKGVQKIMKFQDYTAAPVSTNFNTSDSNHFVFHNNTASTDTIRFSERSTNYGYGAWKNLKSSESHSDTLQYKAANKVLFDYNVSATPKVVDLGGYNYINAKGAILASVTLQQGESFIGIRGTLNGAAPTCSDGIQNQGETGIDCGGPCSACPTPPPASPGILIRRGTRIVI